MVAALNSPMNVGCINFVTQTKFLVENYTKYVFSVTLYVELLHDIYYNCTSHILPRNAKLVVWTL